MSEILENPEMIEVRIAHDDREIEASQKIRFSVFYEEYGALPTEDMKTLKRDMDQYDPIADHLIVLDHSRPKDQQIVGTYRLLRRSVAEQHGQFYTSDEYDISPLLNFGQDILELGRSCVLPDYRTRPVLQKLWEGIAHYVADYNISLMFGCASFHGTDVNALAEQLSYLYHYHRAPDDLCPRALDSRYIDMNILAKDSLDVKKTFMAMPPLMKGYARLGAYIGDGAVIDEQFNTTDVCIVMPTSLVRDKYVKHYERKTQKVIPVNGTALRQPADLV